MRPSIHGHDVLHFMLENEQGFASKEGLKAAIDTRFGADARFHTCSADGLTAGQLIEFLFAKGKFIQTANGFNTQAGMICDH